MTTYSYSGRLNRVIFVLVAAVAFAIAATGCTGVAVSVESPDGHMILNCTFDYLKVGESRKYYVRQSPAAAGFEPVWESSDENVAKVSGDGVVTAISGGETRITVRAKNTPYKSVLKLTVADEIVGEGSGENALQRAVDNFGKDGSVLISGGYYPRLEVKGRVTVTGVGGAAVGAISVCENAELFLNKVNVYATEYSGEKAGVQIGQGASFTAVGCTFFYDDPTKKTRSGFAVKAPSDAALIYCRACSFSGYEKCIETGATNGEIYLVNNDFSGAETAVEIDLREEDGISDKNARGKIADNVYTGCSACVKLYYNSDSYTGSLEIPDADVGVPS